jgi:hypothetical protein
MEEVWSDDPTIQIRKLSKILGALIGKTAKKTLEAGTLLGAISIQLLLVVTWKALNIHLHFRLLKRMEDCINC